MIALLVKVNVTSLYEKSSSQVPQIVAILFRGDLVMDIALQVFENL
jgi:hypothetical protein